MNGDNPSDDREEPPELQIEVPPDVDTRSYVRGLRDMTQYIGGITDETESVYNEFLKDEEDETDDDVCPECGEEMMYNPASGDKQCMNNHE